MGKLRRAKDGHYYERRRTMGGRFYTVQRDPEEEARSAGCAAMFLLALAIGVGLAVYIPYAADQEEKKIRPGETKTQHMQRLHGEDCKEWRRTKKLIPEAATDYWTKTYCDPYGM